MNQTIIEIEWEGPFSFTDMLKSRKDKKSDYGIYCVYGNHVLSGDDTLLYIGKANDQTFSSRISQHEWWIDWEPVDIKIFLGYLGGCDGLYDELKWKNEIDIA